MALEMVLRRMGLDNVTVHGFRSTFWDWCGNHTSYPRELASTRRSRRSVAPSVPARHAIGQSEARAILFCLVARTFDYFLPCILAHSRFTAASPSALACSGVRSGWPGQTGGHLMPTMPTLARS